MTATKDKTIGFIGLGTMGRGMAAHGVTKGFRLIVTVLPTGRKVDHVVSVHHVAGRAGTEFAGLGACRRGCPLIDVSRRRFDAIL